MVFDMKHNSGLYDWFLRAKVIVPESLAPKSSEKSRHPIEKSLYLDSRQRNPILSGDCWNYPQQRSNVESTLSLKVTNGAKTNFSFDKIPLNSTVNERVYLILKTTVRLSHPAPMDLVLRKRVGLNIYKRQSITDRLKKSKWLGRSENIITQSGVTYEVVSNIPKASEELEDRESLAQLAASGDDCSAIDGETYIGIIKTVNAQTRNY